MYILKQHWTWNKIQMHCMKHTYLTLNILFFPSHSHTLDIKTSTQAQSVRLYWHVR